MLPRTENQLKWFVLVFTVLLWAALAPSVRPQPSPSPAAETPVKQKLEEEKLRQETIKLQLENRALSSRWTLLLSYSTLATVLVAIVGLIATLWRQVSESSRERTLDRLQRERDREQKELDRQQREDDGRRRLEEKFTAIVSNLGSDSTSIQASAAVSIMTFLKPEHKDFHTQVFLILLANLKVQHSRTSATTTQPQGLLQALFATFAHERGGREGGESGKSSGQMGPGKSKTSEPNETLTNLLIAAFQKAIRTQRPPAADKAEQLPVDLSRSCLNRADLSNLNLRNVDLAFSELRSANLTDSDLFRVRGFEVHLEKARLSRANLSEARLQKAYLDGAQFHETNLVAADLKETHLRNAQFQQAKLQSTHFEGADLTGARFEQANLSDAFFRNATLPPETFESILSSLNWQKADFDPSVKAQLDALAAKRVTSTKTESSET
jgi:uncharacterized protein YjbI with pentapeptide repeats